MRIIPVLVCVVLPTIVASFSTSRAGLEQVGKRGWEVRGKVDHARRAFVGEDSGSEILIGEDPSRLLSTEEVAASTASIYASLRAREDQISRGVGRRYITKTQKGFLNIHADPRDGPFCLTNIVGQLVEGQIVTSVGEPQGNWVKHDAGGWSIGKFNGVTWLELLDE